MQRKCRAERRGKQCIYHTLIFFNLIPRQLCDPVLRNANIASLPPRGRNFSHVFCKCYNLKLTWVLQGINVQYHLKESWGWEHLLAKPELETMFLWQKVLWTWSTTTYHNAEVSSTSGTLRRNKYTINVHHCFCHQFRQLSAFSSAAAVSKYLKGVPFAGLDEVLFISWWCSLEAFPQPELREVQALLDKAHSLLEDVWGL